MARARVRPDAAHAEPPYGLGCGQDLLSESEVRVRQRLRSDARKHQIQDTIPVIVRPPRFQAAGVDGPPHAIASKAPPPGNESAERHRPMVAARKTMYINMHSAIHTSR